ncbi:AbiTii domain-containing protein [Terrisporobacter muris]|uniref:AbiTii domain-containing protein n=1 Tax=Terrisporobacter muris TaxID=2963284 RepID=A0A9X2M9H2_9FIRM|nr:hypothetical protein [Terrisporobacter muris]MCR1822068.1 hypothetical protein [Terrisporobacter muris]
MARSKLIKDFISSNMDIDTALQNLMVILYCLDNERLVNWVSKELSGYDTDDELPEYRKLQGIVRASFIVGYVEYSKRQFGIAHLDEQMQENLLNTHIYSSISTLIEMKDKEVCIGKPIPPEFYGILQESTNAHITNASVDVDLGMVNDIISKVKTKILETLLFLEKEFGNLDDLDIDISIKTEEELKNIVQKIQVNLYDNSITIGDNNKIKSSNMITNK